MIFSTHPLHPRVTARLLAAGEYRVASSPVAEAILSEGVGAEVLVVRAPVPPEYFARATGLRAAVRHGAGLDMIPVEAATAAGVLVANVPGANAVTVAEHALFAAIGLFTGATTNTPSLGAAQQAMNTLGANAERAALPALAYAVAYPGGVFGVIATLLLLRFAFKIQPEAEAEAYRAEKR